MNQQLSFGSLAKAADVNVETIRYYQRRGLLDEPSKPLGGHRRYTASAATRLRFIKRAQQLGFTLEQIRELLLLEDGQSCRDARLLAERKVELIETRIADLTRMRRSLRVLIAECVEGKRPRSCPIIATLSANSTVAKRVMRL